MNKQQYNKIFSFFYKNFDIVLGDGDIEKIILIFNIENKDKENPNAFYEEIELKLRKIVGRQIPLFHIISLDSLIYFDLPFRTDKMKDTTTIQLADKYIREFTAFKSIEEMASQVNYRPTLRSKSGLSGDETENFNERLKLSVIARAYNEYQEINGDSRRAYEC